MAEGGSRHRLDIVARRPENAVAPSWRGVDATAASFARHPPALIDIETAVSSQALPVAFSSEGSAMPAVNTTAAGDLTASAKIFGEKDTAGARWIAGDFIKYAPAETLIEPRCLEADRVKNTHPAATARATFCQ